MSNIFPEPSINRVDVTQQGIRVYASIDTSDPTVRPFWVGEEDLAPFIKYNFDLVLHDSESIDDFDIPEKVFSLSQNPRERVRNLAEIVDIDGQRFFKISTSMSEIRQGVFETSVGSSVSRDFATNRLHFQADVNFADIESGFTFDRLLEDSQLNGIGISIVYYAHIDYLEVMSHYNITSGLGEIATLGGVAKYQPILFGDKVSKNYFSKDTQIVSLQLGFTSENVFEGYFGIPAILEQEDSSPASLPAPGAPDPFSWRSRIDYNSIYTPSYQNITATQIEAEAVNHAIKQSALRTVQDQSFVLLDNVNWISYDDISGGAHSSMFVIDKLKMLRNLSPLGFLLDKEVTSIGLNERNNLIQGILDTSKIKCMKITRKKLENTRTSSNNLGTSEYNFEHSDNESYIKIYEDDDTNLIGMSSSDMLIEQVTYGQVFLDDEDQSFARASKFILRDFELFRDINYGKYKYEIEISLYDSIPDYVSSLINVFKDFEKVIKKTISDADGTIISLEDNPDLIVDVYDAVSESKTIKSVGNYNFITNEWSSDYAQNNVDPNLENAIHFYFGILGLLGINSYADDPSQFIDSVLPSRNGSLDSLMFFYDSFQTAANIFIKMYDKVTNYEEGLNSEVYGTKRMQPSIF